MGRRYKAATKYECDIAMARAKKLLPCDNKCLNCHACVVTLTSGEREHITKDDDWGIKLKHTKGR